MSTINLRAHQEQALQFMIEREREGPLRGGILALKMGLGKTSTVLELVTREIEQYKLVNKRPSRSFIACSKTVMGEWINEKNKFFPNLKVLIYHRDFFKDYDHLSLDMIKEYDVVVTTYDVLLSVDRKRKYSEAVCVRGTDGIHKDKIIGFQQMARPINPDPTDPYGPHVLYSYPWKRFVTDESQRFANSKTKTFRSICSVYSHFRWCLTGTPIRNSDKDMWSLLFFCGLKIPDTPRLFKYADFHKIKNIMLVMGYQEANLTLPNLIKHDINIDFNVNEYKVYKYYLNELWQAYDRFIREQGEFAGENGFALILGLFCRLRQVCISPYLTTNESKRDKKQEPTQLENVEGEYEGMEEYVHDKTFSGLYSSKMLQIQEIVKNIPKGEKCVIFSSFGACLDLIYDTLKPYYKILIVDGSVTGKKRQQRLNEFRNNPIYTILLCNLRVGAEGINLAEANHVICVELWWSPSIVSQAVSRCYRVGQKKDVHSYKITIKQSIEENIKQICDAKDTISNAYLYGTTERKSIPKLDKQTLGRIIGYYR